jgi:hypothetical protein
MRCDGYELPSKIDTSSHIYHRFVYDCVPRLRSWLKRVPSSSYPCSAVIRES